MLSQTRGLSSELSNNVVEIKTDLIFPWSILQPGVLPVYYWVFKNKLEINNPPELVISCGRKSVYLSVYLKKKFSKIINIHIQNPKISAKNFSFIVAPNHDNLKGQNIINSVGALHYFKEKNFTDNNFNIEKNNLVSCIIGGENNHYFFTLKEAENLCNKIKKLKERDQNLNFLIITSRRTSYQIKELVKKELNNTGMIWTGEGENPYEFALYNSKYFIITSDSTSMISEAAISRMPIYVFKLPFKRKSTRFDRFHSEFNRLNITRDLTNINVLEKWEYSKLDESKRIAGIIKERIIRRTNESR